MKEKGNRCVWGWGMDHQQRQDVNERGKGQLSENAPVAGAFFLGRFLDEFYNLKGGWG
jgi:hypothetical protein